MMKFKQELVAAMAAFLPIVAFSGDGASQRWVRDYVATNAVSMSWVTNYVQTVAGTTDAMPVTWNDDGTQTFSVNGKSYTYPVSVGPAAPMSEIGVMVTESDYAPVKAGTVFALDATNGCYRNLQAFPTNFQISSYTRRSGKVESVLSYSNAVSGVQMDSTETSDGHWSMVVGTNMHYAGSFKMIRVMIPKSYAMLIGVTNLSFSITGPWHENALTTILSLFVGSAYADGGDVNASGMEIDIPITTTINGQQYVSHVYFPYAGPWTIFTPEDPDNYYYSPNPWPTSEDWENVDNWTKGVTEVAYMAYYVADDGSVHERWSSTSFERFARRYTIKPPPYVAPILCRYDKSVCERLGHNWEKCKCNKCDEVRVHSLQRKSASVECDTCSNIDGTSKFPGEKCGSTKFIGGDGTILSDRGHHWGWHHVGDYYDVVKCTCQCGDYGPGNPHQVDEEQGSDYEQGYYDVSSGSIVPDSKPLYHYNLQPCTRDRGNESECGAQVVKNEGHDWEDDKSDKVWWVKWSFDEGKFIKTEVDTEASTSAHGCDNLKCKKCEYKASGTSFHTFKESEGSTKSDLGYCTCTACDLIVHSGAETAGISTEGLSWPCGEKDVEGCETCMTRNGEAIDFSSKEEQLGHTCTEKDSSTHVCACGKVFASHFDDNGDKVCDACGYEMPTDEEKQFVYHPYPVSGTCGNWMLNTGVEVSGGYFGKNGTTNYFPSSHKFEWPTNETCKVCINTNPLKNMACGTNSPYEADHGFWGDKEGWCVCKCGFATNEHFTAGSSPVVPYKWVQVAEWVDIGGGVTNLYTNCYQRVNCTRRSIAPLDLNPCGFVGSNLVDHAMKAKRQWTQYDTGTGIVECARLYQCRHNKSGDAMCGFSDFYKDAHLWDEKRAIPLVEGGETNMEFHLSRFVCDHGLGSGLGCGYETNIMARHTWGDTFVFTNAQFHFSSRSCDRTLGCLAVKTLCPLERHSEGDVVSATFMGDYTHTAKMKCSKEWCGATFQVMAPPYYQSEKLFSCDKKGTWFLNGNSNGMDKCTCSVCDGTNRYSHVWSYVQGSSPEDGHFCSNGGYHFYVNKLPHVWDGGNTNLCRLCGYNKSSTVTHSCKCECGCYEKVGIFDSNCDAGIVQDGSGEWVCNCKGCKDGLGWCQCELDRNKICITENTVAENGYKNYWVNSSITILSGIDPVYNVLKSGFEGACSNCYSLAEIDMSMCTNAGEKAFAYVAFECDKLHTVKFDSLEFSGERCFDHAFTLKEGHYGGELIHMNFGNLKTAGNNAFSHAFAKNTNLHGAVFTNLVMAGSMCFYHAFDGCDLYSVSFPMLKSANNVFNSAFDGCTNLRCVNFKSLESGIVDLPAVTTCLTVDVSRVSANVVVDLSECTNVKEIRFDTVSNVVVYDSRWIPQNNDWMAYVPGELYFDWTDSASGWFPYASHIVSVTPAFKWNGIGYIRTTPGLCQLRCGYRSDGTPFTVEAENDDGEVISRDYYEYEQNELTVFGISTGQRVRLVAIIGEKRIPSEFITIPED